MQPLAMLAAFLLCASDSSADEATAQTPPPSEAAEEPRRVAKFVKPSFGLGAQTEFLPPAAGISGLLFGYDAEWFQAEANAAIGIFESGLNQAGEQDVYSFALRLYLPLHGGGNSDFSIAAGGGLTFLKSQGAEVQTAGSVLVGARARIFISPNVSIGGTLGVAALIRDQGSVLLLGARPTGAAGFTYYFR